MSEINNNEPLKKAQNVLNEISDDEREEELAFQRLMYIMDKKAIEAAGFDKGEKAGFNKGEISEKIKIAKALLKENIDINVIIKVTGLTKEEIEKLNK